MNQNTTGHGLLTGLPNAAVEEAALTSELSGRKGLVDERQ
jgi:hypothetical protein